MEALEFAKKLDALIAEYEATNIDAEIVQCKVRLKGRWFAWVGEFHTYDEEHDYVGGSPQSRIDFVLELLQ